MLTAWYIDDDQEMLQAVRLLLKMLGYQMRPFLKARDAAKILHYGERPDLLILDVNMPEVSGFDMLEFVRRNPVWQHIPIIMLSSEYLPEEMEHAYKLGADVYVTKPATIDELEGAIHKAVEKHVH